MKTKNRSHIVLQKSFDKLQKSNPRFSIRSLALKLGVSHVFVMKMLKGDSAVPDAKLPLLIKVLKLDDLSLVELKDAIVLDAIDEKLKCFDTKISSPEEMVTENYVEFPENFSYVLTDWYHLPILDLLTCEKIEPVVEDISEYFGLDILEVEESLLMMESLDLVSRDGELWSKTSTQIRFPTTGVSEITKNYYKTILTRAQKELDKRSSEDFNKRLITNICIAIDSSKIQLAKERIQKFTYSLTEELSSGDSDEVYFLSTNFFPARSETSD